MLDKMKPKTKGRPKNFHPEHNNYFVKELLTILDNDRHAHKDYMIGYLAGYSENLIATFRSRPDCDPGVMKINNLLEVLGYQLVIQKKKDPHDYRRYGK